MSVDTARAIYTRKYISDSGFSRIENDALRLIVVDSGVLFGVTRATKWLQEVLGVATDGRFGDQTTAALSAYGAPDKLARRVLGQRFAAIAGIVKNDTSQVTFLAGWVNRAVSLLDFV
jgi:lysozyme family protein